MTATESIHAPRATVFFKGWEKYQARYQFATMESAKNYLADLAPNMQAIAKIEMRPYSPIVRYTPSRKRIMSCERTKGIEQAPCSVNLAFFERKSSNA